MREPITIKLSTPILVLNETVHEVTVRPPLGKDLIAAGNPLRMGMSARDAASGNEAVTTDFDMPVMARMIARLCNLTQTAVEDMDAADFYRISMEIMGFLAPTQG